MPKPLKFDKLILIFLLISHAGNIFLVDAFAQSETVQYPPLQTAYGHGDCDNPQAPRQTFCRVKQLPDKDMVKRRLADGTGAWNAGEALTLVYQAKANSIEVIVGGATFPLTGIG